MDAAAKALAATIQKDQGLESPRRKGIAWHQVAS
jgi:hypothetical protein